MKGLIAAILDHFTEFSWKRFRSFVIVILVIMAAFMVFDGYTSFFTMNRLNRGAEVIAKLQSVEQGGKMSPELQSSYETLRHQLTLAVSAKPWAVRLSFPSFDIPYSPFFKFLAGLVPFGLLSIIFVGDIFKRKQGAAAGFLGIWIVSVIFGVISLLVPTFWWPWFNLVIVPVCLFCALMIIGLIMSLEQAKKQRNKQAVSDNPPYDV